MRNRRAIALTSACVLAAGVTVLSTSDTAQAVTDPCMNSHQPVSGPVGCGTFFLPGVGYLHAKTALAITATSNTFGARVVVEPIDAASMQDWTAYQVCASITDNRDAAHPCGDGKLTPNEIVLRFSPYGIEPAGGVNSMKSFCLDDDNGRAVLGFCQSGAAFYVGGFPDPPVTDGVSPVVMHPNPAETWRLVKAGNGVMVVNVHSGRALDDSGYGGPGTGLITWRPKASTNQVWQLGGCTSPYTEQAADTWCQ